MRRPVTVVFTWDVAEGKEAEFEQWAYGLQHAAAGFPGNEEVTWLRPEEDRIRLHHAVVGWADPDSLDHWMTSADRATRHDRVLPPARTAHPELTTNGLETWFDVPHTAAVPPARWKMTPVTIVAVYPFALLFSAVLARYFERRPLPPATLVFPIFLAPLLTYVVMPG
ncbi:antibiotic biosynthesis monooxygenase [Streptomyces sp. NPDC002133]|uniref:antibiotic biosynthesis monooxygenase n=1 Tax=Streptomyces sp. NPDC002133 TaxID=3154409 RepID=UPI0033244C43